MQFVEPRTHAGQVVAELSETTRGCSELVAVFDIVAFEPAGADGEVHAAVGDMVDRAGHVGQQFGVAVAVARDERAELRIRGVGGHHRQKGPRLEMGGIGVAEEGIEVVPDPDGVGPHLVGRPPRIPHRGDGGALRLDLDADMDGGRGIKTRHAAILTHARREGDR